MRRNAIHSFAVLRTCHYFMLERDWTKWSWMNRDSKNDRQFYSKPQGGKGHNLGFSAEGTFISVYPHYITGLLRLRLLMRFEHKTRIPQQQQQQHMLPLSNKHLKKNHTYLRSSFCVLQFDQNQQVYNSRLLFFFTEQNTFILLFFLFRWAGRCVWSENSHHVSFFLLLFFSFLPLPLFELTRLFLASKFDWLLPGWESILVRSRQIVAWRLGMGWGGDEGEDEDGRLLKVTSPLVEV